MIKKSKINGNLIGYGFVQNQKIAFYKRGGKAVLIDKGIKQIPDYFEIAEYIELDRAIIATKLKEVEVSITVTVNNGKIHFNNESNEVSYVNPPSMNVFNNTLCESKVLHYPEGLSGYQYSAEAELNFRVYNLCEQLKNVRLYPQTSKSCEPNAEPFEFEIISCNDKTNSLLLRCRHYVATEYSRYVVVKSDIDSFCIEQRHRINEKGSFINREIVINDAEIDIIRTERFESVLVQVKLYDNPNSGEWNPYEDFLSEDKAEYFDTRVNGVDKFRFANVHGNRFNHLVRIKFSLNGKSYEAETWLEQREIFCDGSRTFISEREALIGYGICYRPEYFTDEELKNIFVSENGERNPKLVEKISLSEFIPFSIVDFQMGRAGIEKTKVII